MKPELHHGDAVAILPGLGPDVIVTDPVWPNAPAGSVAGWDRPYELFAAFCAAIPPTVRRLAVILRNDSDPRFLAPVPARLPFLQVMHLPYAVPGYRGRQMGGHELAYLFGRHVRREGSAGVVPAYGPAAQPHERPETGHPMSRSLTHMRWLVGWVTDPGETVCDPFMGSGQTGVACLEMGRRFVGIEVDGRWYELARARLAEAGGDLGRHGPAPLFAAAAE
jgi:site-specific DNA-methyltransferase (adenine-specific)